MPSYLLRHHDRHGLPGYLPGTMESSQWFEQLDCGNVFRNAFSADCWILQNNQRPVRQAGYYASDVVLQQYALMSTRHGFAGCPPRQLRLQTVVNGSALRLLGCPGVRLSDFLSDCELGRFTARVLQGAGLVADGMEWRPDQRDLLLWLSVRP
ncbi:hypothetical protein [Bordetella avium]|uniref:Uncharacterized protein n=1 Tax=Bordetella avium (strain 197N) TaxID=360910 RepID=Q2L1P0_BORA1|nr:hypothetical protein [Bordetella avium]AZY47781.1 hypothetical protein C0J09_00545 [Bordetella avium]AZY51152.1 hypothetical protein C0J07_00550 [Bordetella avium]RIQ14992.1 hypothetical protein D0432_02375 [Bordetella avium]RIQ18517.1 hypothetical protein D0850_05465 [Bordetella avium]RIQ35447.1 hypothetical protein D0849_05480 [Bordetella avium]